MKSSVNSIYRTAAIWSHYVILRTECSNAFLSHSVPHSEENLLDYMIRI